MSVSDFAHCRTTHFCHGPRGALYIDHHGDRVLADVEGSGSFVIQSGPEKLLNIVDGVARPEGSGRFQESLRSVSSNAGSAAVSVMVGTKTAGHPVSAPVDEFQGCGWIVSSEQIESVDGITSGWSGMAQIQPVPVFCNAIGRNLVVEVVPAHVQTIASVQMNDPGSLAERKFDAKNASRLFQLESRLQDCGAVLRSEVLSHLNQASFSFEKPEGCVGIVIRRLYDAFHGRQRARVLSDHSFVGVWFEPIEDRVNRWKWGHFGFGCSDRSSTIRVTIDPAAGTPLWSVSRYEVWGLFSGPSRT